MQEIRYYDKNGNMVFLMDESDECYYLGKIFKKYEGTPKQIVRKMKIASWLETIGVLNVNNLNRENETPDDLKYIPLIRIKRHNNYK